MNIEFEYHAAGDREFWYEKGRLARVRDADGGQRVYSYVPRAHLEYIRFRNGEEWFAHDGMSAKPE